MMTKSNGFIPMRDAIKASGISRASIYRLIKPRRRGKRIEKAKVRSKNDFRGRRLINRGDLLRHIHSEQSRPLSPR